VFPGPLAEFHEEDWPPVEGECLGHYACRANGYSEDCAPRPGEFCGQLCYESLARDFPGRPGLLARAKAADAYTRYRLARLNWLGEDHPAWFTEWLDGVGAEHEIRWPG
jgi:hypothetical protein